MGWMGVLGTTGSTVDGFTTVSDYVGHSRINFCLLLFIWCRLRNLPVCTVEPESRYRHGVTPMPIHCFVSVRLSSGGRHVFATVCLLVWLSLLTHCLLFSELTVAMPSDMLAESSQFSVRRFVNCWWFSSSTGTEWTSHLLSFVLSVCFRCLFSSDACKEKVIRTKSRPVRCLRVKVLPQQAWWPEFNPRGPRGRRTMTHELSSTFHVSATMACVRTHS